MGSELIKEFMARVNADADAETERWMAKAIERGPGWAVWRSHGREEDFHILHDFMLLPPGVRSAPAAGIIFEQKL
jgi:hypothetical protein